MGARQVLEQTGGIRMARASSSAFAPARFESVGSPSTAAISRTGDFKMSVKGPFAKWEHTHLFEPDGPRACCLEDRVEYALPFGPIGSLLGGALTRRKLKRLFEYRHRVTAEELEAN